MSMLPVYIFRLADHDLIKPKLLSMIESQNSTRITPGDEYVDRLVRTDWYVDVGQGRAYFEYFKPFLYPQLEKAYVEVLEYEHFSMNSFTNVWFNQYEKDDTHGWHRHPVCSFNNVYYLELSEDSPGTELKIPVTNEIIRPEVKEGDVLIFPSAFMHRSPPNQSDERKTIIAFNVE